MYRLESAYHQHTQTHTCTTHMHARVCTHTVLVTLRFILVQELTQVLNKCSLSTLWVTGEVVHDFSVGVVLHRTTLTYNKKNKVCLHDNVASTWKMLPSILIPAVSVSLPVTCKVLVIVSNLVLNTCNVLLHLLLCIYIYYIILYSFIMCIYYNENDL